MTRGPNNGSSAFVDLVSFDSRWYDPGGGRLKRVLWYWVNAVVFSGWLMPSYAVKAALLRAFGARVGEGLVIKPRVNIKYPWRLTLGRHVWLGEGVWIDNLADVTIGANVCVSQGALLLTGNHDYSRRTFDLITHAIVLDDGAWIGAGALIAPGVRIAAGSVVCAGSVVTKDTATGTVYGGNPAMPIRERPRMFGSSSA